jgi:hypothetical protein
MENHDMIKASIFTVANLALMVGVAAAQSAPSAPPSQDEHAVTKIVQTTDARGVTTIETTTAPTGAPEVAPGALAPATTTVIR